MTKRKKAPTLNEVLARSWCYYCERDFDDDSILINHQKAKHFKCNKCNRRLQTINGLAVHMSQVHKEKLEEVEACLPNRNDITTEIFAMVGIPEDVKQQHDNRIIREYTAKYSNAGGNGQPNDGNASKKAKVVKETPESIRARLEEFRKNKAAKAAAGGSPESPNAEGGTTPNYQQQGPNSASIQSPNNMQPAQAGQPMPMGMPAMPPGSASPYGYPRWNVPYGQAGSPPGGMPMPYQPPPPMVPGGSPLGVNGYGPPPGLPARPAMAPPQPDQYQLQQMHSGAMPPQSRDPRLNRSPMPASGSIPPLNGHQSSATATPTVEAPKAATTASKSKAVRPTKLVFNEEKFGPEERFVAKPKFEVDSGAFRAPTVLGQVEQNVTGPSDDSYDQS